MAERAAIFIGNSIFGDDKIGLEVGNSIGDRLEREGFDVYVLEGTGLSLIDCLEGHKSAAIVDSYPIAGEPEGKVRVFSVEDFGRVRPSAPHFAGIPEAVQLMRDLGFETPKISVVGIGVKDPYTFSDSLTDGVRGMLSAVSEQVRCTIEDDGKMVDG
jgi:hydrogenase maturation protease